MLCFACTADRGSGADKLCKGIPSRKNTTPMYCAVCAKVPGGKYQKLRNMCTDIAPGHAVTGP